MAVGKRLPMVDGLQKAAGKLKFIPDINLPGMLYLKSLRSPYPHAKIRKIDRTKAEQTPGVKAILTYEDVPKIRISDHGVEDRYILNKKVRFVGEIVAVVAAVSPEIAEEASNMIDVEYEKLPAVFDPEEAMRLGAPKLHEAEHNLALARTVEIGDVEEGFRKADFVLEDRYKTSVVQHCAMETHACIASFDVTGRLTIWDSIAGIFETRHQLAEILDMPIGMIRVIQTPMGGGYGGKSDINLEGICALISKETCRPVKMVLTREEEFHGTCTRHSTVIEVKTGVKKDGTLVARYMKAIYDTGAYALAGPLVILKGGFRSLALYKCPNLRFDAYLVYTNKPPASAMRGFGNPQSIFATESHMDAIAEKLNTDPMELRLKNHIRTGDPNPSACEYTWKTWKYKPSGYTIDSCGLSECIRKGAEKIGWKKKRREFPKVTGKKKKGIGMACMMHTSGARPGSDISGAFVKFNEDGTVNVLTGAAEHGGCGQNTILAQIVAEECGLRAEDVFVTSADTDITPFDSGSHASSRTFIAGGAVKKAARAAMQQLFEKAANVLSCHIDDLVARDGRIYVKENPEKAILLANLVKDMQDEMSILAGVSYEPPTNAPPFAAHFAEVEVDTETGIVKVLRYVAAHDVGKAINPMLVEGQIIGSVSMGLGYALYEDLIVQKDTGKTMTIDFTDYKLINACDMPKIEVILVETIEPKGPFGAKGVGETGVIPVAPAMANAIYNAAGIRIKELPITPERVLRALKEKSGAKN